MCRFACLGLLSVFLILTFVASVGAAAIEKSKAFCLAAIFYGLDIANPSGSAWKTVNSEQDKFMLDYGEAKKDLGGLRDYLDGKVAHSSSELNAWFAKKGFSGMKIEIPPWGTGIGTVFDLLVDWQVPGEKITFSISSGAYEAVQMEAAQVKAWALANYQYPLFEISTRQGWQVFLVEADDDYQEMALTERALELLRLKRSPYNFKKLLFPVVKLGKEVDISWLIGMQASVFRIDAAKKQVRLRLDDKGARAESAVAIMTRGLEMGVYKIEKPFFIIFWRDGLNFPPFVALAAPDSWVLAQQ